MAAPAKKTAAKKTAAKAPAAKKTAAKATAAKAPAAKKVAAKAPAAKAPAAKVPAAKAPAAKVPAAKAPAAKAPVAKAPAAKAPAAKMPAAKAPAAKMPAAKAPAANAPAAKAPAATQTIAGYIASLSDWRRDVVAQLCALVEKAAPQASGSIKWAQPVYEDHGPFCYVRAFKSHVNLGFWRGADLTDPKHRLQSGGQRMAHIKVTGPKDVDAAGFTKLVKTAVQLNRTLGNPTKRA